MHSRIDLLHQDSLLHTYNTLKRVDDYKTSTQTVNCFVPIKLMRNRQKLNNCSTTMMALSRLVAVVIVLIIITINIISYCCCCCCCQLVLSVIVHAMKSHPCILNEDVQAMLLCGGKDRHHWATMEMSVMFKRLPSPSHSVSLSG